MFCGHAHPAIVRAVQVQAKRSTQFLLPTARRWKWPRNWPGAIRSVVAVHAVCHPGQYRGHPPGSGRHRARGHPAVPGPLPRSLRGGHGRSPGRPGQPGAPRPVQGRHRPGTDRPVQRPGHGAGRARPRRRRAGADRARDDQSPAPAAARTRLARGAARADPRARDPAGPGRDPHPRARPGRRDRPVAAGPRHGHDRQGRRRRAADGRLRGHRGAGRAAGRRTQRRHRRHPVREPAVGRGGEGRADRGAPARRLRAHHRLGSELADGIAAAIRAAGLPWTAIRLGPRSGQWYGPCPEPGRRRMRSPTTC